jgi:hypothetical protein
MTILIPTGDFTGLLADAYPFACTDRDFPEINAMQIRWEGEQLHTIATDRYHIGWSTWDQDDEAPGEEDQPELFETWGGADTPWRITISRDDAKKAIDAFKLSDKKKYVPITLDFQGNALKVVRAKGDNHAAITMVISDTTHGFPADGIEKFFKDNDYTAPAERVRLNPALLAHFAKVRPRGDFDVRFTGRYGPVMVTIGSRFKGSIVSIKDEDYQANAKGAEFLRDGSGVHVSGGELADG